MVDLSYTASTCIATFVLGGTLVSNPPSWMGVLPKSVTTTIPNDNNKSSLEIVTDPKDVVQKMQNHQFVLIDVCVREKVRKALGATENKVILSFTFQPVRACFSSGGADLFHKLSKLKWGEYETFEEKLFRKVNYRFRNLKHTWLTVEELL